MGPTSDDEIEDDTTSPFSVYPSFDSSGSTNDHEMVQSKPGQPLWNLNDPGYSFEAPHNYPDGRIENAHYSPKYYAYSPESGTWVDGLQAIEEFDWLETKSPDGHGDANGEKGKGSEVFQTTEPFVHPPAHAVTTIPFEIMHDMPDLARVPVTQHHEPPKFADNKESSPKLANKFCAATEVHDTAQTNETSVEQLAPGPTDVAFEITTNTLDLEMNLLPEDNKLERYTTNIISSPRLVDIDAESDGIHIDSLPTASEHELQMNLTRASLIALGDAVDENGSDHKSHTTEDTQLRKDSAADLGQPMEHQGEVDITQPRFNVMNGHEIKTTRDMMHTSNYVNITPKPTELPTQDQGDTTREASEPSEHIEEPSPIARMETLLGVTTKDAGMATSNGPDGIDTECTRTSVEAPTFEELSCTARKRSKLTEKDQDTPHPEDEDPPKKRSRKVALTESLVDRQSKISNFAFQDSSKRPRAHSTHFDTRSIKENIIFDEAEAVTGKVQLTLTSQLEQFAFGDSHNPPQDLRKDKVDAQMTFDTEEDIKQTHNDNNLDAEEHYSDMGKTASPTPTMTTIRAPRAREKVSKYEVRSLTHSPYRERSSKSQRSVNYEASPISSPHMALHRSHEAITGQISGSKALESLTPKYQEDNSFVLIDDETPDATIKTLLDVNTPAVSKENAKASARKATRASPAQKKTPAKKGKASSSEKSALPINSRDSEEHELFFTPKIETEKIMDPTLVPTPPHLNTGKGKGHVKGKATAQVFEDAPASGSEAEVDVPGEQDDVTYEDTKDEISSDLSSEHPDNDEEASKPTAKSSRKANPRPHILSVSAKTPTSSHSRPITLAPADTSVPSAKTPPSKPMKNAYGFSTRSPRKSARVAALPTTAAVKSKDMSVQKATPTAPPIVAPKIKSAKTSATAKATTKTAKFKSKARKSASKVDAELNLTDTEAEEVDAPRKPDRRQTRRASAREEETRLAQAKAVEEKRQARVKSRLRPRESVGEGA